MLSFVIKIKSDPFPDYPLHSGKALQPRFKAKRALINTLSLKTICLAILEISLQCSSPKSKTKSSSLEKK